MIPEARIFLNFYYSFSILFLCTTFEKMFRIGLGGNHLSKEVFFGFLSFCVVCHVYHIDTIIRLDLCEFDFLQKKNFWFFMLSSFISCASSLIRPLGLLKLEMVLCGKKCFLISQAFFIFFLCTTIDTIFRKLQVKTIFGRKRFLHFFVYVRTGCNP